MPELKDKDAQYLEIGDEDTRALTVVPPPAALTVCRPPEVVLQEAKEVAVALVNLIKSKPELTVKLNGNDYLKFEAWQTIGKFYGASPKVVESKYTEMGDVKGFEAKTVVIDNRTGIEISAAEAMCLNDEKNWKSKPLFQLKSMAQTRASAKALRNVFAWVVVLAGYKPTPAEEMDGVKPRGEKAEEVLELVEGVIDQPTMSGGSLWFYIGKDIFTVLPMKGQDIKELLGQADKAFVELKVTAPNTTKGGKEYRIVREIVKFEPDVPF